LDYEEGLEKQQNERRLDNHGKSVEARAAMSERLKNER